MKIDRGEFDLKLEYDDKPFKQREWVRLELVEVKRGVLVRILGNRRIVLSGESLDAAIEVLVAVRDAIASNRARRERRGKEDT